MILLFSRKILSCFSAMSEITLTWLQRELSAIVADGAFGDDVDLVSFEQDTDHGKLNQYMSTVVFGTVTTSDGSSHHVVIKLKFRDEKRREIDKIDVQFHNEITMYEKVIPFLLSSRSPTAQDLCDVPSLPRFIYGRNRCGEFAESDMVVLENVSSRGYRLCREPVFLDYDHLIRALQALAKFHALSYSAKHTDAAGLGRVAADIRDTNFTPEACGLFKGDAPWQFGKRAIDRLLERDGDTYRDHVHLRRLGELLAEGEAAIRRAYRPREPHSVVCHGDFNRNNLLFRYVGGGGGCGEDGNTGSPADALPLDFGTPRYGSPALDLSFFLYMNAEQTTRHDHWDRMLDEYCSTVAASVPPGVPVPDRTELDSEMATSALFGLVCALFFLPHQMSDGRPSVTAVTDDPAKFEYGRFGGDEETERVADMVQHFVDMAYTSV